MPISGGRSSVRGVSDLSAVSPLILELAGLNKNKSTSGVRSPVVSGGAADRAFTELPGILGV